MVSYALTAQEVVPFEPQTVVAPQIEVAPQPSIVDWTNNVAEFESLTIPEVITEQGSVTDDPAIEWADNAEQCVVVKKSILGCLEGIKVLPQDEVWFINARECHCGDFDLSSLKVSKLVDSDLVPCELSELTEAHASGDELSTLIYVHGNQTDEEFATTRGLQVYRNAVATKADRHGPVRYVIWAWKSEQETIRFYPDYLIKSDRSVQLGDSFAATLNQFSDRNLVVFGFSLGVRVVLSGFDSPLLQAREGDPTLYQVVFAAPAINAKYVAYRSKHPQKDTPVQQTLIFTNRKDRAIRAAQLIIRRQSSNKDATLAGLSRAGILDLGVVKSVDVFCESGRFHAIERYTRSNTMQNLVADMLNVVASQKSPTVIAK